MSGQFDPGCIRIRLALEDGRVRDVEVASDRPAVASVLRGKQADAAVRLVPLLFALCGKAQGQAAELALAAARGTASAPRLVPAIAAEAMREHLWRCLIDLPPLLGDEAFKPEFSVAAVAVANDRRDQVGAVLADSRIAGLMRRFGHRADIEAAAQHFLPDLDALGSLAL